MSDPNKLKPARFGQSTSDWLAIGILMAIGLIAASFLQQRG